MRRMLLGVAVLGLGVVASTTVATGGAGAQPAPLADGSVVHGDHHLLVTDLAAHKKFWADGLGGTPAKLGTND